MHIVAFLIGLICLLGVVLDAFQTIILPRRPKGRFRITRAFYLVTWQPWWRVTELFKSKAVRDQSYSIFGPLSLILLLAFWATLLTFGFSMLFMAMGTPFADALNVTHGHFANFRTDLYVSGTTLFTLGLGDVVPRTHLSRVAMVLESGCGLGFVALVIGYLPVLYQAFSRRETDVALLDGRAGSPPTAAELLRRHGYEGGEATLTALLVEWERWAAELLESHVSYPILCMYRSQHDNQSWLAALVAILDACALMITLVEGEPVRQAQLTFAMARHALIDLGHVFNLGERGFMEGEEDRLPQKDFHKLCEALGDARVRLCGDPAAMTRLTAIRALYEPHAWGLCQYLKLPLPQWMAQPKKTDAWKLVAELKMGVQAGSEEALRAAEHISDQSVASHLHDEEHGI